MNMTENCSVLDPWMYRSDSAWISQVFTRENEALTRALQISLSDASSSGAAASPDTLSAGTSSSPSFLHHQPAPPLGDAAIRRGHPLGPAPAARVAKRKSRASKRSPTTYINADPANFREMVQRVTGVRLGGEAAEPLVRPEPVRPAVGARAVLQQVCLPTLDTSALLLDRGASVAADGGSFVPPADVPVFDFDALMPAFPTLESWGVM